MIPPPASPGKALQSHPPQLLNYPTALAHALTTPELSKTGLPIEVSLFDARTELDVATGAGIQINGGASVLRKINPTLHDKVIRAALPLSNIRSRATPWAEDASESYSTLLEINLEDAIRRAGGDVERELIIDGEVQAYTIMRGVLQGILLSELPSEQELHTGKALIGIHPEQKEGEEGDDGIFCAFDDGSRAGPFDMVVGCDGVRSAVKEFVERGKVSKDHRSGGAIYSGIRIKFAVEDGDKDSIESEVFSAELRQYFGDGAYGLFGTYGAGEGVPPKKCAYLIVQDKDYIGPFKRRDTGISTKAVENISWDRDSRVEDAKIDSMNLMSEAGLPDAELRPVVENSDSFFELGVYFHNPFSLSGWTREAISGKGMYCVLCGDSAHAMPPFLGQGANQGIQDSYSLATKIFKHNENCDNMIAGNIVNIDEETNKNTLRNLLREYESTRWAPTASITLKSIFLGYLETGGKGFPSKFRDALFFVLGKLGIATKVFLDSATPRV